MEDIRILTADKIGNTLQINPSDGVVNVSLSDDPTNMIRVDDQNKLIVKGLFVEKIPDYNNIAWTDVTILNSNIKSGLSDSSNPLQMGKDVSGNIWIKGGITNTSSSVAAGITVASIPSDYELSGYMDSAALYQLCPIQSMLAGNTTAIFLRLESYNYQQSLAFSAALGTNVSFFIQPTIIGKAKYPFKGVFFENAPNYNTVTWESVNITNANITSGLPDLSDPLKIGKDSQGNIWIKGTVTNTGGTNVAANGIVGTIPVDYQLAGYTSSTSFVQLTPVQSLLAGATTAIYLRMKNYTDVQSIAFNTTLSVGVSFTMLPTMIGRSKY